MKENPEILTEAEKTLLERLGSVDELTLSNAIKDALDEYKQGVFMQDILAVLTQDVFEVLAIKKWDKMSYQKILACAQDIHRETACFFPANDHFLFALSIVWIGYCCHYKKYGYVYALSSKTNGLRNNAKHLEYSLCAQFFNYFAGPATGKSKVFERYMLRVHGDFYRDLNNTNHILNFKSLIYLLSITGFSYQLPHSTVADSIAPLPSGRNIDQDGHYG